MGKESITVISNDQIVKTLAVNLHRDLYRLQSAIVKKDKHAVGQHIESAIERSYELMNRLNESSALS
jgi:hypothetical protein